MALPYTTNSSLAFGIYISLPPIVNVPPGATVCKVRMRPSEFVTVFLRRGRSFEQWRVNFANEKHQALVLTHPMAVNRREG